MSNLRINILSALVLIANLYSYANENIKGRVLDFETKKALPYASIAVSGKYMGTISNSEGAFILSTNNINSNDTIHFSYMGYETLKISFSQIEEQSNFYLKPANINLSDVNIYSRELSVDEIIEKVIENYPKNHPNRTERQRLFVHSFIKTPFSDKNVAKITKSDFAGLDKDKFQNLLNKMPDEFIDYNDAVFDLYSHNGSSKLIPIQGISLEEGDQQALLEEVERQMSDFIADFEQTLSNPDIYYKFRTGILGVKLNTDDSGTEEEDKDDHENDSLSFNMPIGYVKGETSSLIKHYASLEGDNTAFLNKSGKYKFEMVKLEFYNGELVYKIKFKPKSSGIFEGEIFVSSSDFGIHQMDYSYAKGKSTENIQLLGIGHAINYRKGRVIFEKGKDAYHLKYIYAEENEMAAIDRKFSLLKKEKRFLFDKELNEIKFDVDLLFNVHSKWELLVLEHESKSEEEYEKIIQPKYMIFKKELAYSPEDWKNRTYIVPNEELKKYTRKTNSN